MSAFIPSGNSVVIATSATTSTQAVSTLGTTDFMFTNGSSSVYAYVNVFTTSTAVFDHPTAGVPASGIILIPNQTLVLSLPTAATPTQNTVYVKTITASGTANVYVSPGTAI